MIFIKLRNNTKLNMDIAITDTCLPNIVHQWVELAKTNKTVERYLVLLTEDSAMLGVATSMLTPAVLIYMNHANIVPTGVLGMVLSEMASGGASDHRGTNGRGEDVSGSGFAEQMALFGSFSNQEAG